MLQWRHRKQGGKEEGFEQMRFKDKVAIVTGAGRNIGESVATLFAEEGARIVAVDMDEERGQRVADKITAANHDAEGNVSMKACYAQDPDGNWLEFVEIF